MWPQREWTREDSRCPWVIVTLYLVFIVKTMVWVTEKSTCFLLQLEHGEHQVKVLTVGKYFFHCRVTHTHTVGILSGSCLFHGLVTRAASQIASQWAFFGGNLCITLLLPLPVCQTKAHLLCNKGSHIRTSLLLCNECCTYFLCPSQSPLAVLFRRHVSTKCLISYCLNSESMGNVVHRIQK